MAHKLFRVIDFELVDDYTLQIMFNDGFQHVIDFKPILQGEVFGSLRDIERFEQVRLDQEARTLVWPNGGDFDPETLRYWDAQAIAELGQQWAMLAVEAVS